MVEFFSRSGELADRDPEYVKQGFKLGVLSDTDTVSMQNCIKSAPLEEMKESDHLPWYSHNNFNEQGLSIFAEWFRFYDLSLASDVVHGVLRNNVPQIKACLGHDMRIVNVRCWGLLPNSPSYGPNAWHSDCFPDGIHKLLVYLTPPGPLTGTTELQLNGEIVSMDGPPGSWVFFNPSKILHRGLSPQTGERIILEVTIVPAFKQSSRPVFAGNNAPYPIYPWI
jgi:hypothetical protein